LQATVTTSPAHRGERGVSRKTIAQGMPVCRRTCGGLTRVLFIFAREAAGALSHPAFPAPSIRRADVSMQDPDAKCAAGRKVRGCNPAAHPSRRASALLRMRSELAVEDPHGEETRSVVSNHEAHKSNKGAYANHRRRRLWVPAFAGTTTHLTRSSVPSTCDRGDPACPSSACADRRCCRPAQAPGPFRLPRAPSAAARTA
jgi:hypothetical protein